MNGWTPDIDLDAPGKQVGSTSFPMGDAAPVVVPITCISRGDGPTTVLTAGVHGDEYEGQVALSELGLDLAVDEIAGRVIIVPTCNLPACIAGTRLSPIDNLNLNRVFPGSESGSLTERIANFIETELYRRADFALDLHAGGVLLHFLPATVMVVTGDAAEDARRLSLAASFGARHCMLFGMDTMGVDVGTESGMLRQSVIGIAGEFGGSGSLSETALCRAGIRAMLRHTGNLAASGPSAPSTTPILIDLRPSEAYLLAPSPGIFEPLIPPGTPVSAGQVVACLHHPERSGAAPTAIRAHVEGIVMMRRALARTDEGDWLFAIGKPVDSLV
jgi:predicted deacylase